MSEVSRPTLTVDETAELLGISRGLAFQAIHRGEIPAVRIGRRILVPVARLRAMLGIDGDREAEQLASPHAVAEIGMGEEPHRRSKTRRRQG